MTENWLTYAELADKLGCSPEAARAKARRMRWRRQLDNDGLARVLAVLEDLPPARTRPAGHREAAQTHTQPVTTPDAPPPQPAPAALEMALAAMREQTEILKAQLARAETAADVERGRVADLVAQLLRLTSELMEARRPSPPRSWWQRLTG